MPQVGAQFYNTLFSASKDNAGGSGAGISELLLVHCAQQPNVSDCGVFAAAFVFECATASVKANLDVHYNLTKTCGHSVCCLERQEVLAFHWSFVSSIWSPITPTEAVCQ